MKKGQSPFKRIRRFIPKEGKPTFATRQEKLDYEIGLRRTRKECGWYAPKKKIYTDKVIMNEGQMLIRWLQEEGNVWYKDFASERGYPAYYLGKWGARDGRIGEIFKIAKDLQESKLVRNGLLARYNCGFTKFVLINEFGWKEGRDLRGDQAQSAEQVIDAIITEAGEDTKALVNVQQSNHDQGYVE